MLATSMLGVKVDRCPRSRTPNGSWRGLYSGVVLAGIGVGMVVGQGVAVASPSETSEPSSSSQSGETADAGPSTASQASTAADADPEPKADAEPDPEPDAEPDLADVADEAEEADDIEVAASTDEDPTRQSRTRTEEAPSDAADAVAADAAADDGEPAEPALATSVADTPEPADPVVAAVPDPALPDVATAPAAALRTLVSARPVTVQSMVTDVLTWVGLRPQGDDGPTPPTPVSALVQSLWLAVRQTQYTWNNQRPTADATTSGPGLDGVVTGNLNAVDYDDAALTYTLTGGPAYGRVAIDASGGFTYTPGAAAAGRADKFTVRIDDTSGNPFHVHGLLGLLGITRPTEVTVVIAASSPVRKSVPSGLAMGELTSRDGVEVTPGRNGAVGVIDGRFTDQLVVNPDDAAAVLNSLAFALGAAAGFADPSAITASSVGEGADAEHFYRYTEKIGGVPVLGSEVILVTNAAGEVTSVFNYYRGLGEGFDITPGAAVDEDAEVRLIAGTAYLGPDVDSRMLESFLSTSTFTRELVVYTHDDATSDLAWRVTVVVPDTGEMSPSGATYLIDADGASAGDVILGTSNAQAATSISIAKDWLGESRVMTIDTRTVLWFRTYQLIDAPRNIKTYKTSYSLFGLGSPTLPGTVVKRGFFGWDAAAVSAHANMAVVYDYFQDVLGRTSFDDDGALVSVSIRYNPRISTGGYLNAFWDPNRQLFAFGDAGYLQASVDVVAHEFVHAVVSYVVGDGGSVLDYGESGALNEAYGDILGALVEGKTGDGRWLIGEDSDHGVVRNLADPGSIRTAYGPYRERVSDMYSGEGDDRGEHVNSTVFSHAAYLMMTDAATAGVSDQTWAKVFYHSLGRLGTSAKFVDGRAAVLSSAGEQGLTAAQLAAIARAFDTVEIYGAAPSSVIAV
ncbi:M4 family metallopeptidase [Mycolicibacterium austroafricanum]|uniref:M4 family metallopeptidase n=1 Tax=Mycolicibacterium austroafricanum TaxID=39687 RepID=UPI001F48486D|nr:M4 family metallopeptidase [Mycolicibacterium austroafricanum]